MTSYTWATGPWQHPPTRELTAARSRSLTFRRTGGATAGFVLDGRHDEAGEIEELVTDVHVWRDGVPVFRGRVSTTNDDLDADRHQLAVTVGDYRNVLERRLLTNLVGVLGPHTGVDVATIVENIIDNVQLLDGGNLGLALGVGFPFGQVAPDATEFDEGQAATDAIDSLAEALAFDWEVGPDLAVNLYAGGRGNPTGAVLDFGGAVKALKRTVDPSHYANVLRLSGGDGSFPVWEEATDLATRPEGRWEAEDARTAVHSTDQLRAIAEVELEDRQTIRPAYVAELKPGRWQGPSHLWLGDTITLRVSSGRRLDVLADYRIEEIELDLDDDGNETVSLALGAEFPGFAKRLGNAETRLRDLERA